MSLDLLDPPVYVHDYAALLGQVGKVDQTFDPDISVEVGFAFYLVGLVGGADVKTDFLILWVVVVFHIYLFDVQEQNLVEFV